MGKSQELKLINYPPQRAFTQISTFTFVFIECAVHPENRMHSNVITEAILERLQ